MPSDLRSWWEGIVCRRSLRSHGHLVRSARLFLERLERRILLTLSGGDVLGSAVLLPFNSVDTAQASGLLANPGQVDFYQVHLSAGDQVQVDLGAQAAGSGLDGLLRVFNSNGQPVALDDQEGGDPHLTFQATSSGTYYVGVSSAPNDNYNPNVAASGSTGGTTGAYNLNLRLTPDAPLSPDLAGASFRLGDTAAAWGQTVPVSFQVENRGGADAGAFDVQVLLSGSNLFAPASSVVLKTISLPGLAAGQAFSSGDVMVTLADAATAQEAALPASGPVYLGLRIDPAHHVPESDPFDQSGVHRGEDWEKLTVVTPVPGGVTDLSQADPALNTRASGALLSSSRIATYSFTVTKGMGSGEITATVLPTGGTLVPRLTLSASNGQALIQSDSGSLVQNLQPGNYSLSVSAQSGSGTYQVTSEFVEADPPLVPLPVGMAPQGMAVADLAGDGTSDLIVANSGTPTNPGNTVSVLLGNGDGTFQPQQTYAVGSQPYAVTVADLTGDGKEDLIIANSDSNTVSVLLGNDDGTFQPQQTYAVGSHPNDVVVADVNGDGKLDLVVTNSRSNTVSVLLGNGDGTFQPQKTYAVGSVPFAVAVADFNGDGIPDLAVTNIQGDTVSVLMGNGDGTFQAQKVLAVGVEPSAVVAADLNGDGEADLIVANTGSNNVRVLLGNGDGTFQPQQTFTVGANPVGIATAYLHGDDHLDLIVSNFGANSVSVLLGNGDGTFQTQKTFATGTEPNGVVVADFNGDGEPDVAVADQGSNTLSILLGNGDGTFQTQTTFATGALPAAVAVADLSGKNKPDLAVANFQDNTVSVLLGEGDGTFQTQQTVAVGRNPVAVTLADVNGDGKPDLVTANRADNTVSVLLGDGDGTFQPQQTFRVGSEPSAVAAANLTGDGKPDLVVVNRGDNDVGVLLGNGDGTFGSQKTFAVGSGPQAVAVADLRGDGEEDLLVANSGSNTVSVLLGNGDGTFQTQKTFAVGSYPVALTVADVNGDGKPDLFVVNRGDNTVSVLLGNGDGTFQPQKTYAVGLYPVAVTVADLTGDGKPDLAVANFNGDTVSVLLGNGDGTFQPQQTFATGINPQAVVAADLNNDSRPDLVVANFFSGTLSVLLGDGDGTFTPATSANGVASRNTPYLANLTGPANGTPDSVILDRSGDILFRQGLPGAGNPFVAPVVINDTVFNAQTNEADEILARDLTMLRTETGWAIATADALPDPNVLATKHQFVYSVSLYTYAPDPATGRLFKRTTAFTTTLLPTRIAAADLTGDGLDDLVVADSLNNTVQVAFQQPDGTFSRPITLSTGVAPSDISIVDFNGDKRPDIVVSNQASGDVSVFPNDSSHSFATSYLFRAAAGPFGLAPTQPSPTVGGGQGGGPAVNSLATTVGLAAGDFTGAGRNDLVVVNQGSQAITVLANDGGGFAGPQAALTTPTSDGFQVNNQLGPLVAGSFNGPGKPLDLAILMENQDQVWIYTGAGDGTFTHTSSVSLGFSPTGLSVVKNPQTGFLDLLVGDSFGDILRLQGNDDGTFQLPLLNRVTLDTQTLATGQPEILVANQQTDQVTIQVPVAGGSQFTPVITLANGNQTILAPGAVYWAKLDRNSPFADAVVVDSGGNDILIYRGTGFNAAGQPTFAPLVAGRDIIPVGTDPVSVTIQPLTAGGTPDMLVADQGSNDVAELFGSYDANGFWVGRPGPRLSSGGFGPLLATVQNVPGAANPNLVVTNGQSGTMTVLPGVGQGFFNDQNPRVVNIPGNPVLAQAPPVLISSGVGVIAATNGSLFTFNLTTLQPVQTFAPPTGQSVVAVQAMTNGDLVAAFQTGEVALLAPSPVTGEDQVVQTLTPRTGTPEAPSDLEVLPEGPTEEVLVTSEGENTLFVFTFGPEELTPLPTPVVVLPLPEPTGPVASTTDIPETAVPAPVAGGQPPAPVAEGQPAPPGQSPLVLVVTLLAGNLPAGSPTLPAGLGTGNGLTTVATNRFTAPLTPDNQATGEDEGEAEVEVAAEGLGAPEPGTGLGPPASETTPQFELYEKTAPQEPLYPLARGLPGSVGDKDLALLALSRCSNAADLWAWVSARSRGEFVLVQPQVNAPVDGGESVWSSSPEWEDLVLVSNPGPGHGKDAGANAPGLVTAECSPHAPVALLDQDVDPWATSLPTRYLEGLVVGFAGSALLSCIWCNAGWNEQQRGPLSSRIRSR
jgi:hypothetical protein